MGEGRGSKHATINPLEGGGSSRLCRRRVVADSPVFVSALVVGESCGWGSAGGGGV